MCKMCKCFFCGLGVITVMAMVFACICKDRSKFINTSELMDCYDSFKKDMKEDVNDFAKDMKKTKKKVEDALMGE